MKNPLIFLSCIFIIFKLNGQDLKKKTSSGSEIFETYHVLKSNKKVKHGPYEAKTKFGQTIVLGDYAKDERVGIWSFYDYRSGSLEQKYDYDNNEFVFLTVEHIGEYKVRIGNEWIGTQLDTIAVPIGGLSELRLKLIYKAYRNNRPPMFPKEGAAVFSFNVSKTGQLSNFEIVRSLSNTFESDLLKIIEENDQTWSPAIYNGEPVDFQYFIPMNIIYQTRETNSVKFSIDFNFNNSMYKTIIDNR